MSAAYPVARIALTSPDRGKTAELWGNTLDQIHNLGDGSLYEEDFVYAQDASAVDADGGGEVRFGNAWSVVNSAAGGTNTNFATITDPAGSVGTARLTAATGTDWFGASASRVSKNIKLPSHAVSPTERVVHEFRVDLSAADTYFLGAGEEVAEFLSATGTLPADSDYIGFYRLDSGDLQFVCANDNDGGTAVTFAVDVLTDAQITALTDFVKLGYRVNADKSVVITVNGERIRVASDTGEKITVTEGALPIETLNQIYETQRGATGDLANVTIDFDWISLFRK